MTKFTLLKIINPLLFLSIAVQASTGAAMAHGFGLDYMMQIAQTHKYNGYVLVTLAAAHIYLNWAWIMANIFKRGA